MGDMSGKREEAAGSEAAGPPAADGEKRLWAVLLILDTLLLLLFGGALAGLAWIRWPSLRQPPKSPAFARKAEPKKSSPGQAAQAPAQPAAAPRAAGGAEAPSKKAAPPTSRVPTGSPSVLSPELPRREAAPAAPGAARGKGHAPADRRASRSSSEGSGAAQARRPKARAVSFVCEAKDAQEVLLKGPFLVRTGGTMPMERGEDGVWRASVALLPDNYKYYCVIDGRRSRPHAISVE